MNKIRLYLGGFFAFYIPSARKQRQAWLEVDLAEPASLVEILERLGIPPAEVHLAAVNRQAVDPAVAVVHPGDEVHLYPPIGGG